MDAATLYAEALMDLRPWELWTHDGKPQPGTEEIVATLERVLAKSPNHPARITFTSTRSRHLRIRSAACRALCACRA